MATPRRARRGTDPLTSHRASRLTQSCSRIRPTGMGIRIYTSSISRRDGGTRYRPYPGSTSPPAGPQRASGSPPASNRGGGGFQIYLMNPNGTGVQQITTAGVNEDPAWSPEGRHLVFTSNRSGRKEIYVMHADGS